jgi:hypothetical protein
MNFSNRRHQEFTVLTGNRRRAGNRVRSSYPSVQAGGALSAVAMQTSDIGALAASHLARQVPGIRPKEILLVDPHLTSSGEAHNVLRLLADVHVCREFSAARDRLLNRPPDLLVTNVRLQEYNGLHLVHLAKPHTRCIVYSPHEDLVLAREVQAAGAFYERAMRLSRALPGYVQAELPVHDRRDIGLLDRRRFPRGGRRSSDW